MIRPVLGVLLAIAPFAGCQPADAPAAQPPRIQDGWVMIPPTTFRQIGVLAHPRLAEASGAAVTSQRTDAFWTLPDSDNPAELYLVDMKGGLLATLPITGVKNEDWEEVALGPCPAGRCLYIADTGDNFERRPEVSIHRVVEPSVTGRLPALLPAPKVETLRFHYPDAPHDVEAMAVTPSGDVLLVTKGRKGGVLVFRLSSALWGSGLATAVRVDSLPIPANRSTGRVVTGMALSANATRLMVRTYRDLYPFRVDADGSIHALGKPTACDILGREPQGEGIAWLNATELLLTSERGLMKSGTVIIAACNVEK